MFVGQVLEHDICTQGESVEELAERLDFLIDLEMEERGGTLESIPPAPHEFHEMWDSSERMNRDYPRFDMAKAA